MVVHAKIADPIDALSGAPGRARLLDDKRSRLLAPPVAACRLSRFERGHHPLGQWCDGLKERAPHRRKDVGIREHVSLHREPMLDQVTGPLDAVATGERGGASISSYGSQLTEFPIAILGERLFECHSRIGVQRERSESALAVARDDPHRLRRDRTNTGANPRRHGTDREVLRLDCAPDLAGRRISRNDRERSSVNDHETTLRHLASLMKTGPPSRRGLASQLQLGLACQSISPRQA